MLQRKRLLDRLRYTALIWDTENSRQSQTARKGNKLNIVQSAKKKPIILFSGYYHKKNALETNFKIR